MHIASFQDGTVPLSDLEYAKGELHNMHPWDAETCILDAMKCACTHQFSTEMVYWEPKNAGVGTMYSGSSGLALNPGWVIVLC